jgi:MFS transporter, OFA family, oxalate/formate antiporter
MVNNKISSFFLVLPVSIMLLIGSIYAWSIFVPNLKSVYGLSASQTQWIFGAVIFSYTFSMLFIDKWLRRFGFKIMVVLSAIFYATGYLLASFSGGCFVIMLLGIGIISGIGTGLGYISSLTVPVSWYPKRKGLVTGFVSGGFAAGSIILTYWAGKLINSGTDVLIVFRYIGIVYGGILLLIAYLLPNTHVKSLEKKKIPRWAYPKLSLLFVSIFLGTFAGLMIIGNLKLIGNGYYSDSQLNVAIGLFALSNLAGRLFLGWLSDKLKERYLITIALLMLGTGAYFLGNYTFNSAIYFILIIFSGVGFGANFVLFASETVKKFGVDNYGKIYPVIFLGYGFAGIFGPVTGGLLYDKFNNFEIASLISFILSVLGIIVFWIQLKLMAKDKSHIRV